MSGLLARAAELFVAPAAPAPVPARAAAAPPPGAPAAAVLGSPADVPSVARLLVAELRLRTRAGCGLLGEWREAEAPASFPGRGTPSARRLADRLTGRGLAAQPHGRLVRLPLAAAPGVAAVEWERALAAAGCPAVLGVAGPRPDAFEALLDGHDLLAVVVGEDAPPALEELAVAGLAAFRPPVFACRPVPPATARLLAASSIATSHLLGPDLTAAVRALT